MGILYSKHQGVMSQGEINRPFRNLQHIQYWWVVKNFCGVLKPWAPLLTPDPRAVTLSPPSPQAWAYMVPWQQYMWSNESRKIIFSSNSMLYKYSDIDIKKERDLNTHAMMEEYLTLLCQKSGTQNTFFTKFGERLNHLLTTFPERLKMCWTR